MRGGGGQQGYLLSLAWSSYPPARVLSGLILSAVCPCFCPSDCRVYRMLDAQEHKGIVGFVCYAQKQCDSAGFVTKAVPHCCGLIDITQLCS